MKMIMLISVLLVMQVATAQVGVGTTTPNSNAVLDLTSTDRGLLLPRLNDTSNVGSPTEGLMIYNRNTKSPSVHDGTRWSTLALNNLMTTASTDSITYFVSGPGSSDFSLATFDLLALSEGGFRSGPAISWTDLNITKENDINSIPFLKTLSIGAVVGMIEVKIYESGATTPYYSIKLTAWSVSSVSFSSSTNDPGRKLESISLSAEKIGFKDWINNQFFTYDVMTNIVSDTY